jgi:hypothetical protein
MTRRPERNWIPPQKLGKQRGRSWDPFYQFEQLERDDGKPYRPPEPKAELWLLSLLSGKGAMRVMYCLLILVAAAVLGLLLATRL